MRIAVATGYMCKTDYDYHLEADWNGVIVYPNVRSVKANCRCTKACGIVRVRIALGKIVPKGDGR